MKMISLATVLTSKDSFINLSKQNNPIAKQLATAAANADSFQNYALAQWEASNTYNALMMQIADKNDPRVKEAADNLKKAEGALRINKPKYDANVKKFQELLPKLEQEYTRDRRFVADKAVRNVESPPKPPKGPPTVPEVLAQGTADSYDPDYARANDMFRPPYSNPDAQQVSDTPPVAPPIVNDQDRVQTRRVNRRPQPAKPKPRPNVKRGGPKLSLPKGSANNVNINININNLANQSRACPPGTRGISVDSGCTDSTGATFIA